MHGYIHSTAPSSSAFERLVQLLLDLRFQQRRAELDIDRVVFLKKEISAYPADRVAAALDAVVDNHGW